MSSILLREFTPLHVFLYAVEIAVATYFVGFFPFVVPFGFFVCFGLVFVCTCMHLF